MNRRREESERRWRRRGWYWLIGILAGAVLLSIGLISGKLRWAGLVDQQTVFEGVVIRKGIYHYESEYGGDVVGYLVVQTSDSSELRVPVFRTIYRRAAPGMRVRRSLPRGPVEIIEMPE